MSPTRWFRSERSIDTSATTDEAKEVAHRRGGKADRLAARADHPDARGSLAGSAATGEGLEGHVVGPKEREEDEDPDDRDKCVPQRIRVDRGTEGDKRGDRDGTLDQVIDDPSDQARADPGERELQLDTLRRRDANGFLIMHGG